MDIKKPTTLALMYIGVSCGSQNHNQKKISTISMVSEIFLDFAEP
jgi:hypothetical protein